MIGSAADSTLTWLWIVVALMTIVAMSFTGMRVVRAWRAAASKRRQKDFRTAVEEVVVPLLNEIGLSVNNVAPGSPKLVERVDATALAAASADANSQLAKAMGEANGLKIEELGRQIVSLSADVQLALGTTGIAKKG